MQEYNVVVAPLDPVESTSLLNKSARKGWRVAAVLYTNHLVLEREAREETVTPPAKQEVTSAPEEVLPPTDFTFEADEPTEEVAA